MRELLHRFQQLPHVLLLPFQTFASQLLRDKRFYETTGSCSIRKPLLPRGLAVLFVSGKEYGYKESGDRSLSQPSIPQC